MLPRAWLCDLGSDPHLSPRVCVCVCVRVCVCVCVCLCVCVCVCVCEQFHEADLNVFKLLPDSLRLELHREVFLPVIIAHPLFYHYTSVDDIGASDLVHVAASERATVAGEEIFNSGEVGARLLFVTSGTLHYQPGRGDELHETIKVRASQWVSEAVLWTTWEHCGRLSASTTGDCVTIDANRFRGVVARHRVSFKNVHAYARAWSTAVLTFSQEMTDLTGSFDQVQELAQIAFEDAMPDLGGDAGSTSESSSHSMRSGWRTKLRTASFGAGKARKPSLSKKSHLDLNS